jgi:antitoxin CcdA
MKHQFDKNTQEKIMMEQIHVENIRQRQRAEWLDENQEAIAAYNSKLENGVFSDGLRTF